MLFQHLHTFEGDARDVYCYTRRSFLLISSWYTKKLCPFGLPGAHPNVTKSPFSTNTPSSYSNSCCCSVFSCDCSVPVLNGVPTRLRLPRDDALLLDVRITGGVDTFVSCPRRPNFKDALRVPLPREQGKRAMSISDGYTSNPFTNVPFVELLSTTETATFPLYG